MGPARGICVSLSGSRAITVAAQLRNSTEIPRAGISLYFNYETLACLKSRGNDDPVSSRRVDMMPCEFLVKRLFTLPPWRWNLEVVFGES